ncbi:hypothetical protein [Marinomonas rhodophyticola]|uniref:Hippurate hydrolase n=1 Tax=Marinomonas rhodophyticola TaxID=2992803 RepID=A0ABT3KEQ4_9GAMM|nr:hypothetical protein [Marinomonas sp. KJ51-3]MCW4629017.1 hypothetical protein [Marinomonas sp. KJ51-3]
MQSVDELIALRKTLHQNPELSNQEQATAVRIFNEFQAFLPDEVITDLGGTGLAFVFNGAESGPTTLIRSEARCTAHPRNQQFCASLTSERRFS